MPRGVKTNQRENAYAGEKDTENWDSFHKYKATAITGTQEGYKDFFWNCSEASWNGAFLDAGLLITNMD